MDTTKKEYGNKLEGEIIEDNVQSLKTCPKCNDLITQEFPNFVILVKGEKCTKHRQL
jgi:RNA polymerase subunit RPABC4/transcription elongation factor Spt4